MAMQKWVLEIDGDSSGAQKAVAGVSAKTVAMGNILSNLATGAFNLLTSAVSNLAGELLKSVDMASAAQESQMSLASAMQQAGTYTKAAFQANLDYASALQKVSTYGDDDINTVQKALTVYGLEGEALNATTKATLDLAAAKKMDLASAGELVAKSIGTARNGLKAFGVELTDTTDKTEKASQVVQGISSLYGGAAAAATQTFSGKVKQLKETWNDLYEEVGFVITNNKGLSEVFDVLKIAVEKATTWVSKHKEELALLVKNGIVYVIQSLSFLVSTVSFVTTAWTALNDAVLELTSGLIKLWSWTNPLALSARLMGAEWIKALDGMVAGTKKELEASSDAAAKRILFFEEIKKEIDAIALKIGGLNVTYTSAEEAARNLAKTIKESADEIIITNESLIAMARGYTEAELAEYERRKTGLQIMLVDNKISQAEYDAWVITNGTKVQSEEAKQLAARKAQYAFFASTVVAISTAQSDALLSGQKSLGTALEDAWKQTAKALIDAFIDEKVKEIVLTAAGETGKATVAAPMSLGTSLLLIPLIAAAAMAAKAGVHALAGFSEGGIVGPGGSRIPFPSMGGGGGADNAIARVRTGEVIGTPQQIAAAGIGGITVLFNNYGAIGSDVDVSNIGNLLGNSIQNTLRGSV